MQSSNRDGVRAPFIAEQVSPATAACGLACAVASPDERARAANERHANPLGRGCREDGLGIADHTHPVGQSTPFRPTANSILLGSTARTGQSQASCRGRLARQARVGKGSADGRVDVRLRHLKSGGPRIARPGLAAAQNFRAGGSIARRQPAGGLRTAAIDADHELRGGRHDAGNSSAARNCPWACSNMVRATSAETPRRWATTAVFNSPPQRASCCSASASDRPVSSATIRRVRTTSFGVRRLQIDHQVAVRLAEQHHRAGREHVEHELGRGAGLEARRAADDFRPDDGRDHQVGRVGKCRAVVAGQADGEGADLAGVLQAADDIRRSPAGGDADQHVARAES